MNNLLGLCPRTSVRSPLFPAVAKRLTAFTHSDGVANHWWLTGHSLPRHTDASGIHCSHSRALWSTWHRQLHTLAEFRILSPASSVHSSYPSTVSPAPCGMTSDIAPVGAAVTAIPRVTSCHTAISLLPCPISAAVCNCIEQDLHTSRRRMHRPETLVGGNQIASARIEIPHSIPIINQNCEPGHICDQGRRLPRHRYTLRAAN
mmetsp:Transcript_82501/g.214986  ORF Transcript_82501/g.214986 Transcript_82501/m.214986 type:complete len:204 (-) Transcript_82501:1276-1887(-)